jgi:hypothetical protein
MSVNVRPPIANRLARANARKLTIDATRGHEGDTAARIRERRREPGLHTPVLVPEMT